MTDLSNRHPSTTALLEWFQYSHLPAGPVRQVSIEVSLFARRIVDKLPDDPELSAGLRYLLEAKDCFVRATIRAERSKGQS